jgi:sialidase-1
MDFRVLATRGVGGYRQYRIPAMALTPSGKIIAIYDARVDLDDLPGPIDLVIRTSDDNGDTWSRQEVFLSGEGITGYGDASIIIDPTFGAQGRILVFCQKSELASFFESSLGSDTNDPTTVHISLSISDDDGKTWRHRVITDQLKDSATHGIFASSGMGGRIPSGPHEGRLIHSFVLRRGEELLGALAFSDDHGETWRLGEEIPKGNESAVACLADGTVLFHSRSTPHRLSGISRDGGVTIASLSSHHELPDPSDNGSLCVLRSGYVVCTHNHDHDLRRRTVAKRSSDGGLTWPEAVVIETDSSAYSTSCELKDGRIGVLFERWAYTEMVFCRFSPDEFQPRESVLLPELNNDGIGFHVVFRYIRPGRNLDMLQKIEVVTKRHVPPVDMSVFRASERKEIGPLGGSASGDPIFTKEEFDAILGPVSEGIHVGDELRFSGRLINQSDDELKNIEISHFAAETGMIHKQLAPGEKYTFMDLRYVVTEDDVNRGQIQAHFTWRADSDKSGEVSYLISTDTGLRIH